MDNHIVPRLLRTKEACIYVALSAWKLRDLVNKGVIRPVTDGDGSPFRFDRVDLDAYIERSKQ